MIAGLSLARTVALAALAAFVVTLGAMPTIEGPQGARAMAGREKVAMAAISTMSTGEEQAVVEIGNEAQRANADIAIMPGAGVRLAAYAPMPVGAPQYGTALKCLTQAIYYEAANESDLGKRAVAQVVLNRMRHPAYPDSVCGVVYQGANARVCQFSFTCDGALLRKPLARQWMQSRVVAARALAGAQVPEVGSATHYHADYVLPKWAFTLGKIRQIDRHIFYRFPGRAGGSAAFSRRWAGMERIPALDYDRLRGRLARTDEGLAESGLSDGEVALAPMEGGRYETGLTVPPDPTDRHARADVGGRLDTTTRWRMTIPDPDTLSSGYRALRQEQGESEPARLARHDASRPSPGLTTPTDGVPAAAKTAAIEPATGQD